MVPFGPLKEGETNLYVSDLIRRGTCEWNKDLINNVLPDFADQILELKSSKTGARDSYILYPEKTGNYSTRSGYAAAVAPLETNQDNALIHASFNWFKSVWSVSTSPKLQLFLWKTIHGALTTGDNLRRRGMLQNTTCIHCGLSETVEYLLLHCSFAEKGLEFDPAAVGFQSRLFLLLYRNFRRNKFLGVPPAMWYLGRHSLMGVLEFVDH